MNTTYNRNGQPVVRQFQISDWNIFEAQALERFKKDYETLVKETFLSMFSNQTIFNFSMLEYWQPKKPIFYNSYLDQECFNAFIQKHLKIN